MVTAVAAAPTTGRAATDAASVGELLQRRRWTRLLLARHACQGTSARPDRAHLHRRCRSGGRDYLLLARVGQGTVGREGIWAAPRPAAWPADGAGRTANSLAMVAVAARASCPRLAMETAASGAEGLSSAQSTAHGAVPQQWRSGWTHSSGAGCLSPQQRCKTGISVDAVRAFPPDADLGRRRADPFGGSDSILRKDSVTPSDAVQVAPQQRSS